MGAEVTNAAVVVQELTNVITPAPDAIVATASHAVLADGA